MITKPIVTTCNRAGIPTRGVPSAPFARIRLAVAASILAATITTDAHATGILTGDTDARSRSTANAVTAIADDASAVVANPAGLRAVSEWGVLGGLGAERAKLELSGRAPYPGYGITVRAASPFSSAPHAYVVRRLTSTLVAGIGIHSPFGLLTEWRRDDLFPGRYLVTRAEIASLALTPAASLEVSETLAIGVGVDLVRTDVLFERRVPGVRHVGGQADVFDLATMTFDADPATSATFSAGALLGRDGWRLGLVYRHQLTSTVDGDATFTFIPTDDEDANPDLADLVPPRQSASVDVEVPSTFTLGIARSLGESWRAAVDVAWARWSAFDRTVLTLEDADLSQVIVSEYDDAVAARAGAEFFASDKLDLRFGYGYESASIPESAVGPILPDAARHRWAFGFGYHVDGWRFDLVEMLVVSEHADATDNPDAFTAEYGRRAWQFGVSLGYSR